MFNKTYPQITQIKDLAVQKFDAEVLAKLLVGQSSQQSSFTFAL
jgi:hypothetical protein